MREAARIEAAAFYSRAVGDTSIASRRAQRDRDTTAHRAALARVEDARRQANSDARIAREIRRGASVVELMDRWAMTRDEARMHVQRVTGREVA